MAVYNVKLEKFEGPLDLLLELIEKEKLSITELNLAKVADQYLEHIRNNQSVNLENLADFLSVATKLILIKSRALLPILKLNEEEEEDIEDLAKQLEEYKKFKEISMTMGKMAGLGLICYSRMVSFTQPIFYPPENIEANNLKEYFQKVLAEIPQKQKLEEEIMTEVITLEERISDLEITLRQKVETCFSEIIHQAKDKIDAIVSFLAMLEMVKQKIINVEQSELFKEIKLTIRQ
jgi:segregation and condensation protein A